jgi:hypothetical protein
MKPYRKPHDGMYWPAHESSVIGGNRQDLTPVLPVRVQRAGATLASSRPGPGARGGVGKYYSPIALAYPAIEVTLTEPQDRPLARRVLLPDQSLARRPDNRTGLRAGRSHQSLGSVRRMWMCLPSNRM